MIHGLQKNFKINLVYDFFNFNCLEVLIQNLRKKYNNLKSVYVC